MRISNIFTASLDSESLFRIIISSQTPILDIPKIDNMKTDKKHKASEEELSVLTKRQAGHVWFYILGSLCLD